LYHLRNPHRKLTAALDLFEMPRTEGAFAHWSRQNISSRDSVLDGQIDPHTAHGRHGMGRVSNAQQAGAIPPPQPVDPHRQQLHIVPAVQFRHAITQESRELDNACAELFDRFCCKCDMS
jgi:hypothetical protein